ncbi:hypothetical protein PR048_030593, partial [Dryococelus australis]
MGLISLNILCYLLRILYSYSLTTILLTSAALFWTCAKHVASFSYHSRLIVHIALNPWMCQSMYGPFKRRRGTGINAWLKTNPGRTIKVFHLPVIVKEAFLQSVTSTNIAAGFQKTGISPLNVHTFSDDDFASAFVRDRPLPCGDHKILHNYEVSACGVTVEKNGDAIDERVLNAHFQVQYKWVNPFPKAPERNENPRRRLKRRKTTFLIDTPEEKAIEEGKRSTDEKRQKFKAKGIKMQRKQAKKVLKGKKKPKDNSSKGKMCIGRRNSTKAALARKKVLFAYTLFT